MSVEENMALARRFFEARVKTDLDTLDKMLAPDFVSHTNRLAGQQPDREGYKRQVATSVSAFSDVRRGSRKPGKYEPCRSFGTRRFSAPRRVFSSRSR